MAVAGRIGSIAQTGNAAGIRIAGVREAHSLIETECPDRTLRSSTAGATTWTLCRMALRRNEGIRMPASSWSRLAMVADLRRHSPPRPTGAPEA